MIEVTTDKEKILANLEKEIEQNRRSAESLVKATEAHWFTIGKALCKIRDGKLHKQRTFEQYCLQRWDFKRAHAYRLISAFEVAKSLPSTEVNVSRGRQNVRIEGAPVSGRGMRALAGVPKKDRAKVFKAAKKSGKITEKSITEAAEAAVVDVIDKDKVGRAIPQPAMTVWNRRKEINPRIRPLFELKQWAEDMQGSEDILYRGFDFGELMRATAQLILMLQQAIPDVVCTKCQGQATSTCDFCKGRGMISISKARAYTPVEVKHMIDQQTKDHDSTERLSATGG